MSTTHQTPPALDVPAGSGCAVSRKRNRAAKRKLEQWFDGVYRHPDGSWSGKRKGCKYRESIALTDSDAAMWVVPNGASEPRGKAAPHSQERSTRVGL